MPIRKLNINIVSETVFTVRGHGVHTAFQEMVRGLKARPDTRVSINSWKRNDITHIHTVGPYSLMQMLFGRSTRKAISAHVLPDSFVGSLRGAKYWYRMSAWYLRFFYNRADLVVAVSEYVAGALKDDLKIKSQISVVQNTIDTKRYHTTPKERQAAREKLGIKPSEFVIIGVGQIQPRKRFDVFIDLARQLPDCRFTWIGGIPFKKLGADEKGMEKMIASAPKNFSTTGVIELEAVKPYYQAADAFLLPSEQETFGLVVIEAAAAGLPVIVRDISDYDKTFGHEVLRGTDQTFKNIITKLRRDKRFYAKASATSKQLATRFDNKQSAATLVRLYRQLLSGTQR